MLTLLTYSNLRPDYWHSTLMSLLRGLAALEVAAAHLRAQIYPSYHQVAEPTIAFQGLAFLSGFAHLAVVLFFVISGWLVGGAFLNKINGKHAISNYTIDRVTRLWIVLVPVFAISLLLGLIEGDLNRGEFDLGYVSEFSLGAFFGNLVGLQDIVVERFGANFALWSLSNEIWYYIIFPLVVVVIRRGKIVPRILCVLGLVVIVQFVSDALLTYFSIWMLGTIFSRIQLQISAPVRYLLLGTLTVSAVYFRIFGHVDTQTMESFGQDFIFALNFVVWLSSMHAEVPKSSTFFRLLDSVGQSLARFSFTLYALHVPLILSLRDILPLVLETNQLDPDNAWHFLVYFSMLTAIVIAAYLLHLPFEAKTDQLRKWMKKTVVISSTSARTQETA